MTAALRPRRSKIKSSAALKKALSALRKTRGKNKGAKVVFTNGCFDLIHRGHVTYLEQARRQGDVLVVALNADESVRRLKGPSRPVNPLEDRLEVMAALECVDFVTWFEEDTPVETVRKLEPDVYVKGGDWKVEDLPEAPVVKSYGGRVKVLSFVEGRSTTGIIQKISAK